MKKKEAVSAYHRLRTCIIADKGGSLPRGVVDVMRHDLTQLLSQYFDLRSLSANLDYDKNGVLWLTIDSQVIRVKPFEPVSEV